jgi:hypothetical protein
MDNLESLPCPVEEISRKQLEDLLQRHLLIKVENWESELIASVCHFVLRKVMN